MRFGHGYWEVIAVQRRDHPTTIPKKTIPRTHILQRCRHCGKIRTVTFDGDWSDYADGIYDEGDLPKRGDQ